MIKPSHFATRADDEDQFNVVQFYSDGFHEYVARDISLQAAVELSRRCTLSPGAQLGITVKVIITDADDFTNFMWEFGKGITFPPEAKGYVPKK